MLALDAAHELFHGLDDEVQALGPLYLVKSTEGLEQLSPDGLLKRLVTPDGKELSRDAAQVVGPVLPVRHVLRHI